MSLKKLVEQVVGEELRDLEEDLEQRQAFAGDLVALGLGEKEHIYSKQRKEVSSLSLKDHEKARYARLAQIGRPVKQLFNKHADRAWLDSLITIHGFSNESQLFDLLDMSSKDELSCMAILPGKPPKKFDRPFGLVVDGYITLLANNMDDVFSYSGSKYRKNLPQRSRDSGANKGLKMRYDAQDYVEHPILVFDKEDWKNDMSNEALVDNWKSLAIVVSHPDDEDYIREKLRDFGVGLPVLTWDEARKKL